MIFGLCASVALGLVIAIALAIAGGTNAEIDLTFEFSALDGLWFLIGLPILATLVAVLLSPLSFGIYRLMFWHRKEQSGQES